MMRRLLKSSLGSIITVLLLLCYSTQAYAMSTIRDAEIESTVRALSTPIFKAAGLVPENITIILVNDPQINAFVDGGMNLFLNTGLMTQFDKPEVLVGTVAHESGHIAGGHLARNSDKFKNLTIGSVIGLGLGAVAMALGSPDAGMAMIQGSSQVAQREMLQYSRENEEAADQAALKFLDKTGNTASGLLELLEYLNQEEHLLYGTIDPYLQTHPLSRDRIEHIRNHVGLEMTPGAGTITPALRVAYARCYVKLHAYFDPPSQTLKKYPPSSHTALSRYARAIAYQKIPDLQKSFNELDSLLAEFPRDPYYLELKGQILLENGRAPEAVPYYAKAVSILPRETLLSAELATAQIAAADDDTIHSKQLLESAIATLNHDRISTPRDLMLFEQLEIAYGKLGVKGMSYLMHAELASINKNKEDTKKFAKLAEKYLTANTPAFIRAQDLLKN